MTKRHFGLLLLALALLIGGGLIFYDLIRHHDLGQRLQVVALAGALLIGVIGLTLLPLGDTPL